MTNKMKKVEANKPTMAKGGMMLQGFTNADRKQARNQLKEAGKLKGKTKAQRQKMIGRAATRISNNRPAFAKGGMAKPTPCKAGASYKG